MSIYQLHIFLAKYVFNLLIILFFNLIEMEELLIYPGQVCIRFMQFTSFVPNLKACFFIFLVSFKYVQFLILMNFIIFVFYYFCFLCEHLRIFCLFKSHKNVSSVVFF